MIGYNISEAVSACDITAKHIDLEEIPMITAGDFRNGVTFEMDGKVM